MGSLVAQRHVVLTPFFDCTYAHELQIFIKSRFHCKLAVSPASNKTRRLPNTYHRLARFHIQSTPSQNALLPAKTPPHSTIESVSITVVESPLSLEYESTCSPRWRLITGAMCIKAATAARTASTTTLPSYSEACSFYAFLSWRPCFGCYG